MRPAGIVGVVLVIFGALVLLSGGSFTTRRNVLKIGDLKVSADEQQAIPGWAGALSIIAGIVLVVTGSKKRT